jgi:hypothetical protein
VSDEAPELEVDEDTADHRGDIPLDDEPSKGRAVVHRRKSRTTRLLEAQRALELHVAGVEDVRICAKLGISRATLYRRIAEARDFVLDPTVEQYRAEATARIREARRRVYATLERTRTDITPDGTLVEVPACDPAQVAALVGRIAQLEEVEARLRGGFAPTKVDHRHVVDDAFAQLVDELAARPAPTPEELAS